MNTADFLSRLDGVKDRRQGQWFAKCPAHDDRSPSLSVKEAEDGTTLIRCFAGCSAQQIAEAVGLSLRDLFPDTKEFHGKKPRWNHKDVLNLLSHEATLITLAAGALAQGRKLTENDFQNLLTAVDRLEKIRRIANNG